MDVDESVFDVASDESDFAPATKSKTQTKTASAKAAMKPAAKKAAQPKAKAAPKPKSTVPKKRTKDEDDDSDNDFDNAYNDESLLADTPPKAEAPKPKKQKVAPNPAKSPHKKPLAEMVNENMAMDEDSPKLTKKKRVSEQYQKLTQLEHIIRRPDTYIGSTERTEKQLWVYNSESSGMEYREISYVPGLFKIFDEVLVNAADNKQNDSKMKYIKVTIDRASGEVSVENDGRGIPVEVHSKEKIFIPEMIFGHLLTGSNYDDAEQKVTGGRNGYGAKLCNIFSTEFTIETVDSNLKKKYKQTWTDNMSKMGKAKISDVKGDKSYTKVTFKPDFTKFKMDGMDDDHESLFKRRVYDMAGTCRGVQVYLNGDRIPIRNFKEYISMYTKAIKKERGEEAANDPTEIITETPDVRWEIGFAVSDGSFQQVSFVNSIATTVGGTHVNYVADQITNKLAEVIKKKDKKGVQLKLNQIRNHIFIFVNCLIVNPAFSSQTKEQLTTKASQFGSKCTISDEFMKKVQKTQVVPNILSFAQQKADQILKKSDGTRRSRMHDPKLTDANKAGTRDGHLCTLILTEGDSAMGMAMAGRAVVGADLFGVFPLRGKLLNVRDASIDQISKNKEIQNIKNFLGLQHKKVYTDTKGLRYGHLMIMTDQDHDGSHIKGLLINFLQVQFPSLLTIPNFLVEFITPIVKVYKGDSRNPTKSRAFYTMPEYLTWKESHKHERGWEHKYYKGLGTSSAQESQEYFNDIDKHHKEFDTMKDGEAELIDLAFSKKKADQRKEWLRQFKPGTYFDYSVNKITYTDFINKELILFSMADNIRSIPSVIDGFKPTQRKVLYTCFRRNIKKDMKVVELAGIISGLTAYQHGDTSLQQTIVGLAQTFVGSNNVNCLEPAGQFGTRLQGGSDAASARYIYTRLSPFARKLFHAADEPLLTYNTDDERQIEPEMYVPVVPLVLINGSDGIGTGWSSNIPNYNPEEIVENLKRKMDGEDFKPMQPWFRGFKGAVTEAGPDRFKFSGIIKQTGDNEVEITELPIRVWTQDFKEKLEEIIKAEKVPSFIKDYEDHNTHKDVHFIIKMDDKHIKASIDEGLEERFKLSKTLGTTNLVAFDPEGRITKYNSVDAIMEEFYAYRLRFYQLRKDWMLKELERELKRFTNQARFIKMIIDGKLIISKKKKAVLITELQKLGFDAFPKLKDASKAGEMAEALQEDEDADDDLSVDASSYDYLLGMPLWSLTEERVEKLQRHIGDKEIEIDDLLKKSKEDLWRTDLDEFIAEWRFQLEDERERERQIRKGRRTSKKFATGKSKKRNLDDDDWEVSKPKKTTAASKPKPTQPKISQFTKKKAEYDSQDKSPYIPKKASMPLARMSPLQRKALANFDGSSDDFDAQSDSVTGSAPASQRISSQAPKIEDDSDVEQEIVRAAPKAARTAATKKSKYQDLSDSDSDDDDPLAGLGDLVKPLPSTNGEVAKFKPMFSTSTSRPSSSHGTKPSSKAASKTTLSDAENDVNMTEAPAAVVKPVDVFDLSDVDDEPAKPVKKTSSQLKKAVPSKPKATKPPAKKTEASVKKQTQSPMAKAYAKRLAKKAAESDDELDAMADDILDSPSVSDDDQPVRKPAARPARRAAAAPGKTKKYNFDDSDEDEDHVSDDNDDEGSSAMISDEDD